MSGLFPLADLSSNDPYLKLYKHSLRISRCEVAIGIRLEGQQA